MKKIVFFMLGIVGTIGSVFSQQPTTVQGFPYDFSKAPHATVSNTSVTTLSSAAEFTMDDIECWVGEGSQKAALAVQWNEDDEETALVWGYLFEGDKYGIDILRDIAQADPRLYILIEHADASMGFTICGVGYDRDGDGNITLTHTPTGQILYPSEEGIFYTLGHYDYDDYQATDPNDYWGSGWYSSYWSYWVKEGNGNFAYSGLGASSRRLSEGSWDGWNFARGMTTRAFKPFVAAPTIGYTSGALFLNQDPEGQSSLSYYAPKDVWEHDLYEENNEGASLVPYTHTVVSYGKNVYFLASDPDGTTGSIQVAEANKFIHQATIQTDARVFAGVTPKKGYVGTGNGICAVDLENYTLGSWVADTENQGQTRALLYSDGILFAIQDTVGICRIDVQTEQVTHTLPGVFTALTQSVDGTIWAAAREKLFAIHPCTGDAQEIAIPAYCSVEGAFLAHPKENVLFWTSSNHVFRYEPGKPSSLESVFFSLPEAGAADKPVFSGNSMVLDVANGHLLLNAVTEKTRKAFLYEVDAQYGDLVKTIEIPENALSPVQVFLADVAPSIAGIENSFTVEVGSGPILIPLHNSFTDPDHLDYGMELKVVSENPGLVTVELKEEELWITPVPDQSGETNVIMTVLSNGKETTRKIAIQITRALEGIALSKNKLTVKKGSNDTLTVQFNPVNATNQNVTWGYSSYNIVSVTNGVITGRGVGEGYVFVKSTDGAFADTCWITVVNEPLTGIELNKNFTTAFVNQQDTLSVIFSPLDASDKTVKWTSDDVAVATVSSLGVITGKGIGSTMIRVTANDGGFEAVCQVVVSFNPATSMSLNAEEITLDANSTSYMSASFLPWNASNKNVTWSSSNPEVASVSTSGAVKGLTEGTAVITAQSQDNPELTARCTVTVNYYPVTAMTLKETEKTVVVGASFFPYTTFTPSNASNQTIECTSSNEEILEVLSYGYIKALAPGTAILTARTVDGDFESTCEVTIVESIPVEAITLSDEEIWLKVGATLRPSRTFIPSNATNQKYTYRSEEEEVAILSDNYGTIKAVALGTTTVTVTTDDGGHTASVTVHVVPDVESVRLHTHEVELTVGDPLKLSAIVAPVQAIQTLQWTSSDEAVAVVDEEGVVTTLRAGSVLISAISTDNANAVDTCTLVVVNQLSESLLLEETEKELFIGEGIQLTATVLPENTTNARIRWTSSDPSVATVTSYGYVIVLNKGTAIIKAISQDGGSEASFLLTGLAVVTGVELPVREQTLFVGQIYQLQATVKPEDALITELQWGSSDESVAVVDANGMVHALKEGKTDISVTTVQGNYTASCELTVVDPTATGLVEGDPIRIYPTLTSGIVYVELPQAGLSVQVLDNSGRILQTIPGVQGKVSVDLTVYEEGVYYIKVNRTVTKVIKHHSLN